MLLRYAVAFVIAAIVIVLVACGGAGSGTPATSGGSGKAHPPEQAPPEDPDAGVESYDDSLQPKVAKPTKERVVLKKQSAALTKAQREAVKQKKAASKLQSAKQLLETGKKDAAIRSLKELVEQFPGTPAAEEAESLLTK